MCGIVGSFHPLPGRACDLAVVERMRDRMVHRGPDGAGAWRSADGRCALGHRRLSIIDLSDAAGQPMANADGSVVIVFNGEIYNHADLRRELTALGHRDWRTDHSDTEVLLRAYEQWGLAAVERMFGMFAVGIYDARDPSGPVLHLVRDRLGVKPLYLARTPAGEWLFASEIRALMAHPAMTPDVDLTALWHYLTFIVAPAPLTLFRGVFKLPNAHTVTIDASGRAEARRWWDAVPSAQGTLREGDLSLDEAVDELAARLRTSIARRMVADVPFGVLLSGGVDSSLNVALMSELMDRPVTTFTVGYRDGADLNEFAQARRIAELYGTDHHETLIDHADVLDFLPRLVELQDEPIADNVCIPLYFLSKLVRDSGTTVVQVGEGADENFLGYWWCEHYRQKYEDVYVPALRGARPALWRRLVGSATRAHAGLTAEDREIAGRAQRGEELFWGGAVCWWGDMRRALTPDPAGFRQAVDCPVEGLLPDAMRDLDSHAVVRHHVGGLTGTLREPEVLQKIPHMEMRLRLPEHLLMRVDKMTMAHSIEARVPFLDHEVVEFATRLPPAYKLSGGVGKMVLKRLAERHVPHDLIYRRKQGFGAPMDAWLREESFGRRCLSALEGSALCREGLIDRDHVTGMMRDHLSGRSNHGFHLWTVLNAVLWHQAWIESEPGGTS